MANDIKDLKYITDYFNNSLRIWKITYDDITHTSAYQLVYLNGESSDRRPKYALDMLDVCKLQKKEGTTFIYTDEDVFLLRLKYGVN